LHPVQPAGSKARPLGAPLKQSSAQQAQAAAQSQNGSLLHMSLPSGSMLGGSSKEHKLSRKEKRAARAKKGGKWYSFRKWSLRSGLVVAALVLVMGGFLGIKTLHQLHKVLRGGGTAAALQSNVKPQLLKGEGDGRINFLLLGRGGDGHDGPDLTDTILVASIDPVNKTAALVSVPRDLWVTAPSGGATKINAIYANAKYAALAKNSKDTAGAEDAGEAAIAQEVTAVLGIPIHYHVLMDFQAFKEAVDAVGGVDVNVPEDLVDPTMAWENGWNATLAKKGLDHMGGVQALQYVRSRHTSARGDFDRTERQRLLIEALSQKVLSAGTYTNPLKISQLLSAFGNHVSTDLSVNDSLRLMTILKGVKGQAIQSVGLADPPNNYVQTGDIGSASVVLPTAGQGNYTAIQSYIRNTLKDPYIAKENASVEVLNGTTVPGLAGTTGDTLKTYGYNVTKVDSAPSSDYTKTTLVDLTNGKKPYTKNYLQKRFNATVVTKLPDATIQATGADFVVILGQDATANSQN
jgi:LCP family protein required for cell wall assembly